LEENPEAIRRQLRQTARVTLTQPKDVEEREGDIVHKLLIKSYITTAFLLKNVLQLSRSFTQLI
jgi:hypothetical protein